jgi:hypothetical protein
MRDDSSSSDLVVRESPISKNVSTETENIFGISFQVTTDEDIEN